jgi:hypothetical protein
VEIVTGTKYGECPRLDASQNLGKVVFGQLSATLEMARPTMQAIHLLRHFLSRCHFLARPQLDLERICKPRWRLQDYTDDFVLPLLVTLLKQQNTLLPVGLALISEPTTSR